MFQSAETTDNGNGTGHFVYAASGQPPYPGPLRRTHVHHDVAYAVDMAVNAVTRDDSSHALWRAGEDQVARL